MRIAIVNDLALAREVLRRLVQSVPGYVVAWTAENGEEPNPAPPTVLTVGAGAGLAAVEPLAPWPWRWRRRATLGLSLTLTCSGTGGPLPVWMVAFPVARSTVWVSVRGTGEV